MSANHTPGPWSFGKVGKHAQHIDGGSGAARWWGLCKVFVRVEGEPDATGEANARLIAAAPELLEALVALNADYKLALGLAAGADGPVSSQISRDADTAIAKATGSAA